MTVVVVLFGAAITILGIIGLLRPNVLIRFALATWQTPTGRYLAIGIRIVFGILLLATSSSSRFPLAFQILGIISIVAAIVIAMIGTARLHRFIQWWAAQSPAFLRAWLLIASGFGAFIIYAVW